MEKILPPNHHVRPFRHAAPRRADRRGRRSAQARRLCPSARPRSATLTPAVNGTVQLYLPRRTSASGCAHCREARRARIHAKALPPRRALDKIDLELIEVQTGCYGGEDDIVGFGYVRGQFQKAETSHS
jgi:hypothetical protein